MATKRRYLQIFFFFFAFLSIAQAQLPPSCNGTASAIACDFTCISCNFNGFSGSTEGYPSGIAPEFCGTVENVQWLGFIAGTTQGTFTIMPSNCVNGDGVQVALYTDCELPPLVCDKGEMDGGSLPVSINTPLTVGASYFLLIDGYAGDQCQFTVSVSPVEAVFQPPLGVASILTGPTAMCPNTTADFQVQPVAGASAYIWTGPPGTLFDSLPSPATILAPEGLTVAVTIGNTSGTICVQAANACESNPPCSASIPVSVLDDSARPVIVADTLSSLTCTGDPLALNVNINPLANIDFAWTVDSTGGHIVGNPGALRLMVDSIGVYHLLATNTTNGCTSTATVRVTEPNIPDGAALHLDNITCYQLSNGAIRIDSVSKGTPPFLYSIDGQAFTTMNSAGNLPAGSHSLSIQDAAGCEWDTIFVLQQPDELLVVLEPDTTIALGTSIILWDSLNVNYPERPVYWLLTIPEIGDTTHCAGCAAMPIRSFRYLLEVRDSNGCRALDERTVIVTTERHVYFPNVFTPGAGESVNERFGPHCGDDVTQIEDFQVFNQWGHLVHERSNVAPNDYQSYWDGKVSGRTVSPAVYVYQASIRFKDGAVVKFKGDITLVR